MIPTAASGSARRSARVVWSIVETSRQVKKNIASNTPVAATIREIRSQAAHRQPAAGNTQQPPCILYALRRCLSVNVYRQQQQQRQPGARTR